MDGMNFGAIGGFQRPPNPLALVTVQIDFVDTVPVFLEARRWGNIFEIDAEFFFVDRFSKIRMF